MTYDGGFPSDDNSLAQGLPSGGTNNCGLGGATLRFEPEASGDPQNHGLNKAAALLWSKVRGKHPRLSQADLWVLAAYVAVEVLGGPRIEFTGGRFDAKDGSRSYLANDDAETSLHDSTEFEVPDIEVAGVRSAVTIGNKISRSSRLLPLDCGPLPVSNKVCKQYQSERNAISLLVVLYSTSFTLSNFPILPS